MTDSLQITYETDATLDDIAADGKEHAKRVDAEVERINAEFRARKAAGLVRATDRLSKSYQLSKNTHIGRLYGGGWG